MNGKLVTLMRASVAPGPYGEGYGITLRQHFAVQLMPAVIAAYVEANGRCIGTDHIAPNTAAHAVRLADALLAELAKET